MLPVLKGGRILSLYFKEIFEMEENKPHGFTLGEQIQELQRCKLHLEGKLMGHNLDRLPCEQRIKLIDSIIEDLLSKGKFE